MFTSTQACLSACCVRVAPALFSELVVLQALPGCCRGAFGWFLLLAYNPRCGASLFMSPGDHGRVSRKYVCRMC